jgi:catechol 2,3-dioxygenase-like lactoylglutathione lyase family enzyme
MTIIRLHHVQITIPRGMEKQGREFYCDLLGLAEIEKPEALRGRGGFWLQVGDRQVHVGSEDGVQREATRAHIAYEVDDIMAWRTRLQEHGIAILEAVPLPGYARFEIRDPFGNRVEFTQVIA